MVLLSPRARTNALTVVHAQSAVIAQAVVESETKVLSAAKHVRRFVKTARRRLKATPKTVATKCKAVNPVKVAVGGAAMAVDQEWTVKHRRKAPKAVSPSWALRTGTMPTAVHLPNRSRPLVAAALLRHRATRMANPAKSAAATAMDVSAKCVENAKSALTFASRPRLSLHSQA